MSLYTAMCSQSLCPPLHERIKGHESVVMPRQCWSNEPLGASRGRPVRKFLPDAVNRLSGKIRHSVQFVKVLGVDEGADRA